MAQAPPQKRFDTEPLPKTCLRVGAITGIVGLATGGLLATLRYSKRPAIFAVSQGIEWALLGSTVWGFRGLALRSRLDENGPSGQRQIIASTLSGVVAFPMVTTFTRPGLFLVPFSSVVGAFTCYSLQKGAHWLQAQRLAAPQGQLNAADSSRPLGNNNDKHSQTRDSPPEPLLQRIGKSRFSPFSVLTDEEYSNMLREKLLHLDAEIALIDESIDNLALTTKADAQTLTLAPHSKSTETLDTAEPLQRTLSEEAERKREG